MIAGVIVVLLFALLAAGAPIGFALIVSGSLGIFWIGGSSSLLGVLSSTPRDAAAQYEFLTVPMFLLMAELVLRSGIADDLFRAAAAWFGRVKGGLGIATALAGAGFAAICGSSTASAATLSSTSLPAMIKHGYEPSMAAGVVAISGTLSMLIPPAIAMVVYALLANVSVAKMLIAGIVPGALVTLTIALTVYVLVWQDPARAPLAEKTTLRERILLLRLIGPMLLLLILVTGAIYSGLATPTEASALGAFGAAVLYFARARRMPSEVYLVCARATRMSCMLGIILLGAHIFTTFFALTQTTQSIIAWVGSLNIQPWIILVCLILIYIVLGSFMDQMAILVLTVPVVAPLLSSLGYDLIWFGVIKIVTAELGMVTPPIGLNANVVAKYANMPQATVFRGLVPHVIAHLIIIAILLSFPAITLWLPGKMS